MAAMFAGASRALLASVVFAFETTRQPLGLLPLLGGCTRRVPGLVPADAQLDHDREDRPPRRARRRRVRRRLPRPCWSARDATRQGQSLTLAGESRSARPRAHGWRPARRAPRTRAFPCVDGAGALVGVLTRRDSWSARPPAPRRLSGRSLARAARGDLRRLLAARSGRSDGARRSRPGAGGLARRAAPGGRHPHAQRSRSRPTASGWTRARWGPAGWLVLCLQPARPSRVRVFRPRHRPRSEAR